MKAFRKLAGAMILAVMLSATAVTAFAATYKTPAEAVAGLTGRTVDSIVTERTEKNKSYGTIALEAGKLEEFKTAVLEIKKDNLDEQVKNGTIARTRADEILKAIKDNQITCDGTGTNGIMHDSGLCPNGHDCTGTAGTGTGAHHNNGAGNGTGKHHGGGRGHGGMGLRNGSCYNN